jgi:hypothetical protein
MATKVPIRYLPYRLTKKDTKKQIAMLKKSRKMYSQGKYFTRKPVASFKSRPSHHVANAKKIYGVDSIMPSPVLAQKTGCSLDALQKIVAKGEGAYFSSGSRPNQTAQSWGVARLASSITSGKSAAVDFDILREGCDHRKKAYQLAVKSRKKWGYGKSHTKRRQT